MRVHISIPPPVFKASVKGDTVRISQQQLFWKTGIIHEAICRWKIFNDVFSHFDTIPECEGQMDRHTELLHQRRTLHSFSLILTFSSQNRLNILEKKSFYCTLGVGGVVGECSIATLPTPPIKSRAQHRRLTAHRSKDST